MVPPGGRFTTQAHKRNQERKEQHHEKHESQMMCEETKVLIETNSCTDEHEATNESEAMNQSQKEDTFSYFETLKFCLPLLAPDNACTAWVGALCVVSILGAKVFHLAMGLFMKIAVDALSSDDPATRAKGPYVGAFLFLFGRLAVALFTQAYEVCQEYYAQRVEYRFGVTTFEEVMRQSVSFHACRRTGETTEVVRRGIKALDTLLRQLGFWLLPTVIETIYVTFIFCRIGSPLIAGAVVVTVVLHVAYTAGVTRRRAKLARATRDAENEVWAHATERISHHATVSAFGAVGQDVELQRSLRDRMRSAAFVCKRQTTSFNVTADVILQTGTFICFLCAARDAVAGVLSVGDFTLAVTYVSALFWPLLVLAQAYGEVVAALANIEQLIRLLQVPRAVADATDAIALPAGDGSVQFDCVSFAYDATHVDIEAEAAKKANEEDIGVGAGAGADGVRDLSFVARVGHSVALVGPSGAGKSTIVRLLLRLHDAQRGAVLVNGVDVRCVTQSSLRANIALVDQDTVLFNASIRDNLTYGLLCNCRRQRQRQHQRQRLFSFSRTDFSGSGGSAICERCDAQGEVEKGGDAAIWRALRAASLDAFVRGLPHGLDTMVGERGVRLSGGERQRVGIARAVLRAAPVLVLDEATSSLSSLDERAVQAFLAPLCRWATTVVVAHRLSTVRNADEIIVLDKGRIVERGRHDDLVTSDGLYAKMWHTQAGNQ